MKKFDLIKKKIRQLVTKPNERSHSISTWKWVLKLKPEASVSLQIAALGHDIDRSVEGNPVNFQQSAFKRYDEYKRHHSMTSAKIMYRLMVESGFDNYTSKKVKNLVEHHEHGKRGDVKILTEADSLSFFEYSIPRYMRTHTLQQTRDKIRFMYCRLSSPAKNLIDNMDFKDKRAKRIVKEATCSD